VRSGGEEFGQVAMNQPEHGFYNLLQQFPAFGLIAGIATFVGLLFYVTSADSGALVMGNLTSYRRTPRDDASRPVRIFWALATGLLTLAMLLVGGVPTLQNATIIMGLPFAFVLILLMLGLYRALRLEAFREDSHRKALPGSLSGRSSQPDDRSSRQGWRRRLRRSMTFPEWTSVEEFLVDVAQPAMRDVAVELGEHGVTAQVHEGVTESKMPYVELLAELADEIPFRYRVLPMEAHIPS